MQLTKRGPNLCVEVELSFDIKPKPKQSVRQGQNKKTKEKIFFRDSKVAAFETEIWALAKNQMIGKRKLCGPISVRISYIYPLPSGAPAEVRKNVEAGMIYYKETQPDITDNLNKAPIDALKGVVFDNDNSIVHIDARKIYGRTHKIRMLFRELPQPFIY